MYQNLQLNGQKHKKLTNPEETVWGNIYDMPLKTTGETKIQTIQYCINLRIIPCNEWLYNIKITDNKMCHFCNKLDDISHFFIYCKNN